MQQTMHPAVRAVAAKFAALELHAARSGREVMAALAQVAADSTAADTRALASEIEAAVEALLAVMPPYAPPLNVMHRLLSLVEAALAQETAVGDLRTSILAAAADFQAWSSSARDRIAGFGAALIPEDAVVFTYTLSETALRTLLEAWRSGKSFRLLVTESRPNQDGLVTANELSRAGVPVGISLDACLGELLRQADVMLVGAEAINADGSAVCKVGTYLAALVAHEYGVPVYVVVDTLKFNVSSLWGLKLKLDPIRADDLSLLPSMAAATVVGHLFDQTPAELICGVVTERGVIAPGACAALMLDMPASEGLRMKLANRARHS